MIVRNHKVVQYQDITLTDEEVNKIFLQKLYRLFKWNEDYFIEDGNVVEYREVYTSHRFDMKEIIRPATREDYDALETINNIKQQMKES